MSESRSSTPFAWTTALVAAAGALLLALTVLVRLRWDLLLDLDDAVTRGAKDAVDDSATTLSIARALTHLGDPAVVSLATLVLALGLLAVRRYRAAVYLCAVRLAVVVATAALKAAVARERPDELHPVAVAHGYSFPSGHASGSAALWCSVALLLVARMPRLAVAAVALVVPLVVAASRVLLGVHFLSDVVGGLALGAGLAVALAHVIAGERPSGPLTRDEGMG